MNNVTPASIVGINPGSGAVPPPTGDDDFADFQAAGATAVPPSGNRLHLNLLKAMNRQLLIGNVSSICSQK